MYSNVKFVLELRAFNVNSSESLRLDAIKLLAGNWSAWVTGRLTVKGFRGHLCQHCVHLYENVLILVL